MMENNGVFSFHCLDKLMEVDDEGVKPGKVNKVTMGARSGNTHGEPLNGKYYVARRARMAGNKLTLLGSLLNDNPKVGSAEMDSLGTGSFLTGEDGRFMASARRHLVEGRNISMSFDPMTMLCAWCIRDEPHPVLEREGSERGGGRWFSVSQIRAFQELCLEPRKISA